MLDEAFIYIETVLARNGQPTEPYWWNRRIEILHLLVDLYASHSKAAIRIDDYAQYLKSSSIGAIRPKVPTVESILKDGKKQNLLNWPMPFGLFYPTLFSSLEDDIALLSYTNGQRYTVLTITKPPNISVGYFDPDIYVTEGWDRFFRPTSVDFESRINVLTPPTDAAGSLTIRLEWIIGEEYLEVITHTHDIFTTSLKRNRTILDKSVAWEEGLYKILISPFTKQIRDLGVRHLVISPDGGLNLVPFHLLRSENSERLVDQYLISYSPNLFVLANALEYKGSARIPQSLLIVKDTTGTLPWAWWEAEMVRKWFDNENVVVLDRDNATKDNLRAAIRDVDVIHFCAHARFDSERVEESGLCIKDGRWLTLGEIEELNLRHDSLVFLSACDTARLKLTSRVTPMGICPAFLNAGAATVISTFWQVHDASTALIANRFYQEYIGSQSARLTSLHQAVNWVRHLRAQEIKNIFDDDELILKGEYPFSDSYYWGAFALYGAWR